MDDLLLLIVLWFTIMGLSARYKGLIENVLV